MNSIRIISLLLVINILRESDAGFKSRMKGVQNMAKDYFKTKFGKNSKNILGIETSEYPGTNPEYRKINKEKWQIYYDCLEMQKSAISAQNTLTPEAVVAVEAGYIRLACKICLSPSNMEDIESVEWSFAPVGSNALDFIELTENTLISQDKALEMYNLQVEHSGQYLCTLGYSLTTPYFLSVVSQTQNMSQVHSKYAINGPFPKPPEVVPEYNLVLNTVWGPWSGCNKCRKVGRRYKLGFCTITIEQSTNVSIIEGHRKRRVADKLNEKDLEILKLFDDGIPCDSHILPESIQNIPQIKNRKNEIMLGYCKMVCKDEQVFEVKDKMGNVIERANNSAGIYSLAQGLPAIEPQIERRLQYEEFGEDIVLLCPGNLNSKAPVEWQIGGKNVVPEILSKESNGRIFVSITDKIHIKKSKLADSNLYSCWQHKELAGTIRLVVEERFKMNFNHHMMMLGVVIIMSTFLYVFVKAYFGRKFAKV